MLACMMAKHGEAAIVRRFDILNIKNLLYKKAELVHLEAELRQIEQDEKSSVDCGKSAYPFSVYELQEAARSGHGAQWTTYQDIQSKLEAYNGAVLQYHALRKIAKPASKNVQVLREWLDRPEGGDFFLGPKEADMWDVENDLLSLHCRESNNDPFITRLMNETLVPWYHRRWGHRAKVNPISIRTRKLLQEPRLIDKKHAPNEEWYGLWQYDQEKLETIVNVFSTLLASLLPSVSILILYLLTTPVSRLIAISGFSVLFSVILSAVSASRRIEIFAATTA
ncbi:MAG: hypothetical protein L6R40_002343 [Gallowayella cf. fulva]|nr:MAG: hypothetical protein L6R40_002343 [Xanthomendoza cf. fulva]